METVSSTPGSSGKFRGTYNALAAAWYWVNFRTLSELGKCFVLTSIASICRKSLSRIDMDFIINCAETVDSCLEKYESKVPQNLGWHTVDTFQSPSGLENDVWKNLFFRTLEGNVLLACMNCIGEKKGRAPYGAPDVSQRREIMKLRHSVNAKLIAMFGVHPFTISDQEAKDDDEADTTESSDSSESGVSSNEDDAIENAQEGPAAA